MTSSNPSFTVWASACGRTCSSFNVGMTTLTVMSEKGCIILTAGWCGRAGLVRLGRGASEHEVADHHDRTPEDHLLVPEQDLPVLEEGQAGDDREGDHA